MRLVFGLLKQDDIEGMGPALEKFCARLSAKTGDEVVALELAKYEELSEALESRSTHVAWLPPLLHMKTDPRAAIPLVSARRGGEDSYESVLVARKGGPVKSMDDLAQRRAAWVDPWSAAGFVVPRIWLDQNGYDPRRLFRSEVFFGTHTLAITAVVDGVADVAGTFARFAQGDEPRTGGWRRVEGAEVQVVQRFGPVPPDTICVSSTLDGPTISMLEHAFVSMNEDPEAQAWIQTIFGADEFRTRVEGNYGDLRRSFERAQARGLFGA